MKTRNIISLSVLLAVFSTALSAGVFIVLTNEPDSRFTLSHLAGKAPDDVIKELGPPVVDHRSPQDGGWTPALEPKLGPLVFVYRERVGWRGFEYAVFFRRGQVSEVRVGEK
jgi:hypothetical protein